MVDRRTATRSQTPPSCTQVYPGLDAAHIITGTSPVNGLLEDRVYAVIVSMGCAGVIYSVVIEVVPLAGSAQVTTQTSWLGFLAQVSAATPALKTLTASEAVSVLRNASDPRSASLHAAIASAMQGRAPYGGLFNAGLIPAGGNQYADLAFNP